MDKLRLDGGWLSAAGLSIELRWAESTIEKVLWRLRREGQVVHRLVELSVAGGKSRDNRSEWRAVQSDAITTRVDT